MNFLDFLNQLKCRTKVLKENVHEVIVEIARQEVIQKPHLMATCFFFLSGFSFTDTDNSQDSREREGTIFYFTLPLPPAHEHSDIYLQLCM